MSSGVEPFAAAVGEVIVSAASKFGFADSCGPDAEGLDGNGGCDALGSSGGPQVGVVRYDAVPDEAWKMADEETRFAGVKRLGVDEYVWHHVSEFPITDGGRGPKLLTGMVDFTPDENWRV